ncbi:MAG: hypothetical protein QOC83_4325 [Pseudonocardiales bacterium]|nr:hypothetical protein [Pseudonocardiales bacterium]
MNIAMLIPGVGSPGSPGSPGTYRDAWQIQAQQLAVALGSQGHRVTIYTRRCRPGSTETVQTGPGLAISSLPAGPPVGLSTVDVRQHLGEFADLLAGDWHSQPPQVVHAHTCLYGLAALLAARQHCGVPVVQTLHGLCVDGSWLSANPSLGRSGRTAIERTVAGKSDAVIAQSATELSELVRLGVSRARISTIPYGVDARRMSPDGPALAHPIQYRLTVLDPLTAQHGVDDVVTALATLPDTELIIAGGPPASELDRDEDAGRIRRLAARIGVAHRVSLLGGIPSDRVPSLLRSSDAVVSVPWSHATGKVALDAMACGVPVICTRVGGMADAVVDGITGLHVLPRRPDQLTRTTRRLLLDRCRRTGFAMAGRDRILSRYGWPRIASETFRLYERLSHA